MRQRLRGWLSSVLQQFTPLSAGLILVLGVSVLALAIPPLVERARGTTIAAGFLGVSLFVGMLSYLQFIRHRGAMDRPPPSTADGSEGGSASGHSGTRLARVSTAEFALAVFASAFIATAIYGLQLAIQNGYDERNFRLLLATSPDLRGFSPPRDSKDIPLGGPFSLQNVHLRAKHLGTSDLRYVNLSNADLQYTHLGGSTLSRANLTDAELKSAYLWYADLRCANFHRANLYGADLRNADLRGANLQEADLRYSDMRGALMDGDDAQLKGAKLEGACRPGDPYRAACADEAGIGFEHTAGRNATLRPVTSKKAGCPYAFEPSDSAD